MPPGVIVLRPEPGNAATLAAARALGLAAAGAPLFRIEPVAWTAPDPTAFDAVVFGSANALAHAGARLSRFAALPAYAVGEATAAAARQAGFTVVAVGRGGIAELLPRLVADDRRRALRLAGEAHVALPSLPSLDITTLVAYAARPLPLSQEAAVRLRQGAIALLHSAEAARHFVLECERAGIDRARVRLACLGPRIAEAAGGGWGERRVAAEPTDPALLALAREMCQTAAQGVAASQNE
jgi:uroporphyrinogen-III synthase